MTEIQPPPDPYKLLGANWPEESATDYKDAASQMNDHKVIHADQSNAAVTNAGQTSDQFLGLSGGKLADQMHVDATALESHGATAEFISKRLRQAAKAIQQAKKDIAKLVVDGTDAINKAKPNDKLKLINDYKSSIARVAADLEDKLAKIGDEIEGGAPAVNRGDPGAQSYVASQASRNMAPEQEQRAAAPPAKADALPAAKPGDPAAVQPQPASVQPTTQPGQPGAPQPGQPGAPQPGAPGAPPVNPASTGGGQGGGQSGTGGGGNQGAGGQGGTGGGNQGGGGQGGGNQQANQGGNQNNQPSGPTPGNDPGQQPQSPFGDVGVPPPITQLTSALAQPTMNAANAVAPAVTNPIAQAVNPSAESAVPQSAIPSVAPPSTGATPGVSIPPSAASSGGMTGGGGLGAPSTAATTAPGGPTTTAPLSPEAKLVSATQPQLADAKEPPKPSRPNSAAVTPVPTTSSGIPISAAALAGAATSAVLIDPDSVVPQSMSCDFLQRHDAAQVVAHITLAPIRAEFSTVGWTDCPIAVGVFRTETGHLRAMYVTADAVSLWPLGAKLPAQVIPVSRVDGFDHNGAGRLAGSIDLRTKLIELVPKSVGTLEHILTNDEQTPAQAVEIVKLGDAYPVSQLRSTHTDIPAEKAAMEVTDFMMRVELRPEMVPNIAAARHALIHARWGDPYRLLKLGRYDSVLTLYLLREALDCLAQQQYSEAGFSIGELLDTLRLVA